MPVTSLYADLEGRKLFNEGIKKLWVEPEEIDLLRNKYFPLEYISREKEKNHSLANRNIKLGKIPGIKYSRLSFTDQLQMI